MSKQSKFKLVKRGFPEILVLIPGWAADYRIFDSLELNYDYILPIEFNPFNFEKNLADFLEQCSIKKVSLFGWSLGAFLAEELAYKCAYKIDGLFLLSIRRRYNLGLLQDIERKVQKNKKAFLYKFYMDCFSPADKFGLSWFKKNLLKKYIDELRPEELISGLDYLSSVYLKPQVLSGIEKISLFHGEEDKIAPFKEAQIIKSYLPQAKLISLKETGHMPFLNQEFKGLFNE